MRKTLCTFAIAALGTVAIYAAEHDKDKGTAVTNRLQAAEVTLKEIMGTPDKGVPTDLLERGHCAVIIPGMKKGAFIVGAKYGKGFVTCRTGSTMGWSAPAAVKVEGGSFGAQIGGGETEEFMLVMNSSGAQRLLKSEFKIGGEAGAMAGPVGRSVSAETDATMRAEILTWSRSRGAFAGISLEGSTLREDKEDNEALYAKSLSNEEIVRSGRKVPPAAAGLISQLSKYSYREHK